MKDEPNCFFFWCENKSWTPRSLWNLRVTELQPKSDFGGFVSVPGSLHGRVTDPAVSEKKDL